MATVVVLHRLHRTRHKRTGASTIDVQLPVEDILLARVGRKKTRLRLLPMT